MHRQIFGGARSGRLVALRRAGQCAATWPAAHAAPGRLHQAVAARCWYVTPLAAGCELVAKVSAA